VSGTPDPELAADDSSATATDDRLWLWFLAVGMTLVAVYVFAPSEPVWFRDLVVYPVAEACAVAATVVGVRHFRPSAPVAWLLMAAGLFAFMVGDVIWGVYGILDRDPFPSVADLFYLGAYPFLVAGLAVAVMRRRPFGVDLRALLDAGLLTVIAGLLAWVFIIQPALDDPDVPRFDSIVLIAYPLADLALLAVAVRFVMGSSWNVPSLRLLVGGLALTLVGDVIFALSVEERAVGERAAGTVLLIGIVFMGVAGLHPSMTAFTEEAGHPGEGGDVVRVVVLVAASMVPPLVLVVQGWRDEPLHVAAVVAAMLLVSTLIGIRALFTTNNLRGSAHREAGLNRYGAELLAAGGRDELFAAAQRAVDELVGKGQAQLLVGAEAERSTADHAFTADVEVRGGRVAVLVADPAPARLRLVRDSLTTVATQLSIALERDRLLATEREAAETLASQNEQLRELDRLKDTFVSSVSHELRTPLTSMVGYLELMRDGEAGELNEDQQHWLDIVDRNCHRLNDLIEDILVTSRMDTGRFSLTRGPVDLVDLVATQVESIRASARRKGVELVMVAEEGLPPLQADEMRLGQLVDNLLSNAVKFTAGGGTVTSTITGRDSIERLQVADTGVGIPHDELDKLFDRFYRASTASAVAGTGLGLSIARAIAEAHGGSISVTSEIGVGTTFTVDLPVPTDASTPAPDQSATEVNT
jgi:signal transduction histidine kinase